ncbi:MAG: AAA family ATPase, partial [Acidimicrobiia bacterium]
MVVDGVTVVVDTRKAVALLSFLAVEKSASRDTMAALLWAESSSNRARATLRRTLSALRSGIGADLIESDRDKLSLVGPYRFDVDDFEAALSETYTHDHDPANVCEECIAPLSRAAALYRGDFLAGFSVRDAPEFEDWVRSVSQRLRIRAGEVLHRLAMAQAAEGDYPGAIAAVTRWVDLDSLHEPAHRLLMLLNAWAGDRPGAVDAYRGFVALLDRELGVAPLEETTELYDAILDEDLPPPPGLPRKVRAKRAARPEPSRVLLDRTEEMETLRRSAENARMGGQMVVLSGQPWMGKTRLLEELAGQIDRTAALVVVGRAFRLEQAIPYGVVAQLLRALRPAMDAHASSIPEWAREETARLTPATGPAPIDLDSGRFGELRLLEATFEVVATICAQEPIVLLLDDAQWMDAASARVISYLGRRIDGLSACLVVALREEEPLPEPLQDLVARANTVVDLEPLTPDSIADRLSGAEDAAELMRTTGGVPLLVLEALNGSGEGEIASPGVMRFMKERLGEVGDLARQVLAAASVLTGVCDAELLRHVSGRSEEEVVAAVEELVGARLLREVPGTGAGLGFTLDSLEELTYESISLVRRRLLHKRAA